MGIASINPATGETLKTFDALSDAAIAQKIEQTDRAFRHYRHTPFADRAQWMQRAAAILEERKAEFGKLMTLEMGKPIKAAIAEVEKSAWVCRFYAENAEAFLADVAIETDASRSFVRYQPIGIVLAVMPWNFPFWQVFRFVAPALMAGNVGLLKHASNVPQSALAIEEVVRQAGFPDDVFQTLLIPASKVAGLMEDDRIKAATLTGSEPAGQSLAQACGAQIKKTVLELGGSDPFVVMTSADLPRAIETAVTARMINNGQSCIAAKRFIVQDSIFDRFAEGLAEKYKALKVGNPLEPDVAIGPLATSAILQELEEQVQHCVDVGAKVLVGGKGLPTSPSLPTTGTYYPPTILTEIPVDAPVAQEELFGPVATLFRVADVDEALAVANNIPFGLGASAWTQDAAEGDRFLNELEAGSVFLNGMVKSDPRLPFGGIKRSGYGRELGREGILEFVNAKTIWIR